MIRYLKAVLFVAILAMSPATANAETSGDCNPKESGDGTCQLYPILQKPNEFTTSTKGLQLAVRRWIPAEEEPKAVLLFQHGGAGFHSAYSDIMGQSLSKAGIAVIAYDQAGSGHSEGERNWFDSMDTVCDDYTKMLQKVKAEFPQKKVFAMGESFGGLVVLAQSLREQDKIDNGEQGTLADGYILTGPVIKLLPEMLPPKPVVTVLRFLAKFFPMLTMPGTDFFSTFDLAFGDKVWALTGRNDPIIQEAATIAPRLGMVSSVLQTFEKINASFDKVQVPLKILMGEKEGRVDTDAIKQLAKDAASKDKDFEIVPNGYHQLFQDVPGVTSRVCESVQTWILKRA